MKQRLNGLPRGSRPSPALRGRNRWIAGRPLAIIGGCGHVGLPLGMAFARTGCAVDLIDLAPDCIDRVNRGEMPFFEAGADELLPDLVRSRRLRATDDSSVVKRAGAVIVTIGTPAGTELDLSGIHRIVPQLRPRQLLVLRSTVPPGATDQLARQLALAGRRDVDLAYCPERIVQGKSLTELSDLPQLIAGVTPRAAQRAASLFQLIATEIVFLRPIEAELAKLFCNAYRYIHFAISNQFYQLAQHHGADFYKVYHALRQNYPRMQSFARPGFAAGPCLVKDTMHLASNCDSFELGEAALSINESLPEMLVRQLHVEYPLSESTVGILGMAFKPECDDPRDSLSYKLRDLLTREGSRVLCTDPYVSDRELVELDEVLKQADLLVVGTPHDCYRGLKCRQPIVDITGTLNDFQSRDGLVPQFDVVRANGYGRFIAARNGKTRQRKRA